MDRFFFGRSTLPEGCAGLACVDRDTRLLGAADFIGVDAVIDLAAISNDPAGELDPALTWQINHLNLTVRELAQQVGAAVGVSRVHSYPGLDDRSHRMDFAKIRERLGFVPSRPVGDGAREVADAISQGGVDVDDPKTMTVQWYQHLLASGANSPVRLAG